MARTDNRLRWWLVVAARFRWGAFARRVPRPEPRQERFTDRPFPFLVKWGGVLVPVEPTVASEGEDARGERRWLDAAAAGMRN